MIADEMWDDATRNSFPDRPITPTKCFWLETNGYIDFLHQFRHATTLRQPCDPKCFFCCAKNDHVVGDSEHARLDLFIYLISPPVDVASFGDNILLIVPGGSSSLILKHWPSFATQQQTVVAVWPRPRATRFQGSNIVVSFFVLGAAKKLCTIPTFKTWNARVTWYFVSCKFKFVFFE